ncbi:MAG: hypothetical protein Q4A28_01460 [Brachymonas sp.]|nr:hypothetical protein [Brachymonas sp.]
MQWQRRPGVSRKKHNKEERSGKPLASGLYSKGHRLPCPLGQASHGDAPVALASSAFEAQGIAQRSVNRPQTQHRASGPRKNGSQQPRLMLLGSQSMYTSFFSAAVFCTFLGGLLIQHLLINPQLVAQVGLVLCQRPLLLGQAIAVRQQQGVALAQGAVARMAQLRILGNLLQWHVRRFQAQQKSDPRRIGIAVNPLPTRIARRPQQAQFFIIAQRLCAHTNLLGKGLDFVHGA